MTAGVAFAATTGALIAMGHRAGSVEAPFAAIGALLIDGASSRGTIAPVLAGFIMHLAAIVVWSLIGVWLVEHVRWRTIAVAVIVGVVQFGLSATIARATGRGLASALIFGDRLVFSLVLALSLVVGMRFAFFPREMHQQTSSNRAHPL